MVRRGTRQVYLPYLIRDLHYLRQLHAGADEDAIHLATPLQSVAVADDGCFLDGPVCPRVAIVDWDLEKGKVRGATPFVPQGVGRTVSEYALDAELGPDSAPDAFEIDSFIRVSPFATVLKMLAYFEGPEVLGRPVTWAFPSEQLLVVPRAADMSNAFYERESGSLQFFYHESADGHTVYTALSHDIVVHETTHAILDGLAPDLYHAITPESLALHEAVADLSAISQVLLNEMVLFSLEALTGGDVEQLDTLSRLAQEFGADLRRSQGANFLRRMRNRRTLNRADEGVDEYGVANRPDETSPHALSQALSGAVFNVFVRRMEATERNGGWTTSLDKTFLPGARRVARIVFRALDYLPPGDVSFADYGRAFVAAAASTYARPQKEQAWLTQELLDRHVIAAEDELRPRPVTLDVGDAGVEALRRDDRAARRFVERNRAPLGIPARRRFSVLPRVVASRSLGARLTKNRRAELVFKVRWQDRERHDLGPRFASRWAVTRGTTVVFDCATGAVLSVLTTDPSERQRAARGALLRRWADDGRLRPVNEALGPDGRPLTAGVSVHVSKGVASVAGSGRLLHIEGEEA